MAKYKVIPGGVCAAKGFSASGVHAGFRANPNKLDLAIIKADVRCAAAGVYTTNKVYGAPIKVDRAHLVDGHAQAVLVNSGNANTCAANGVDLANASCALVAQQLARSLRAMSNSMGSSMETLYKLADGKAEALEFKIADGSAVIGVPLKTLKLKPNIIISAIVRGNRTIIPGGDTEICAGDHAVVVAKTGRLKALDDIVED